jgi:hypothetical protein
MQAQTIMARPTNGTACYYELVEHVGGASIDRGNESYGNAANQSRVNSS